MDTSGYPQVATFIAERQFNLELRATDLESLDADSSSATHYLCGWNGHLTSRYPRFLICKVEIITLPNPQHH